MVARDGESGVARPLRHRADPKKVRGRLTAERGDQLALAQPDLPRPGRVGDRNDERTIREPDRAGRVGGGPEDLTRGGGPGVDRRDARDIAIEPELPQRPIDRAADRLHSMAPSFTRSTSARSRSRSGTPPSNAAVSNVCAPSGSASTSAS